MGLLRSRERMSARGVGDRVELHLPEMGVRDWFQVVGIEACPEIESGEGRVVTGGFSYSRGTTYRMRIAGEREPLRVTDGHPFWDVDLGDWSPAGEGLVGRIEPASGFRSGL